MKNYEGDTIKCPWCNGDKIRNSHSYKKGALRKCLNVRCVGYGVVIPLLPWRALARIAAGLYLPNEDKF